MVVFEYIYFIKIIFTHFHITIIVQIKIRIIYMCIYIYIIVLYDFFFEKKNSTFVLIFKSIFLF